jgi:acyl-CoA thioesterase FadM
MCMVAYAKAGTGVVTGELTVRYVRPVPTGTPLVVAGRITETRGRSFFIAGTIRLADGGEELTRAQGRFFAAASSDMQETTA